MQLLDVIKKIFMTLGQAKSSYVKCQMHELLKSWYIGPASGGACL